MAKVLIAEDNEMIRRLVVEELTDMGYTVLEAADGQEALELLGEHTPDLILSDIRMPRMDGYELFRKVQASGADVAAIPFLFLSAVADKQGIAFGRGLGADDYITKPVDFDILRATVRSRLQAVERTNKLLDQKLRQFFGDFMDDPLGKQAEDHRQAPINLDVLLRQKMEQLRKTGRTVPAASCMKACHYEFRTPRQAQDIAFALASLCPDPPVALIGLSELLLNAVEHGNLGIGSDRKAGLVMNGMWEAEIEQRLSMPEHAGKKARVEFGRQDGICRFIISDEGNGFDHTPYLDLKDAKLDRVHGRGIALARQIAFSSLEYRNGGNRVIATVSLSPVT